MSKKLKTIKLSGKEYAQVAERLRAIHVDHKDFDIITNFTVTEAGNIIFYAKLTIRDKVSSEPSKYVKVSYTGHSFGKNGQAKAFEKLETIAVGRALAFAGYHADGEIASADEIQDMGNEVNQEAITDGVLQIMDSKTVEDLEKTYKSLAVNIRQSKEVIEAGKKRKKELTEIE